MDERFNPRAQNVLRLAFEEAKRLDSVSVEPDHLLLGLLRENRGITKTVLMSFGLSESNIPEIEAIITNRDQEDKLDEIPLSESAQRVLALALLEADELKHNCVGAEHILLGILRHGTGGGASYLREAGAQLLIVRDSMFVLEQGKTESGN